MDKNEKEFDPTNIELVPSDGTESTEPVSESIEFNESDDDILQAEIDFYPEVIEADSPDNKEKVMPPWADDAYESLKAMIDRSEKKNLIDSNQAAEMSRLLNEVKKKETENKV